MTVKIAIICDKSRWSAIIQRVGVIGLIGQLGLTWYYKHQHLQLALSASLLVGVVLHEGYRDGMKYQPSI